MLLDVKVMPLKLSSKRVKREIHRSNTCPTLEKNTFEQDESKSGQRKSKRLRKSNISPPTHISEKITVKKEPITSMKSSISSTTKETNHNQIIVKTDKRYYWCTKCSKIYRNLISLYTESHYRQCVGDNQHFNVVHDSSFFTNEEILPQLPSTINDFNVNSDINESSNISNKKESIFFAKPTDDSRTYFINGKPVRMSIINRPMTVKDLRQQFQQQTSFTKNNPNEEYLYQQQQRLSPPKLTVNRSARVNENNNWTNESLVKVIPKPRSFDTFGISSDDDDDNNEKIENRLDVKQEKPEIEKTLVKRRYNSEYVSSSNTITAIEQDNIAAHKQSKQFISRKIQSMSTRRVNR